LLVCVHDRPYSFSCWQVVQDGCVLFQVGPHNPVGPGDALRLLLEPVICCLPANQQSVRVDANVMLNFSLLKPPLPSPSKPLCTTIPLPLRHPSRFVTFLPPPNPPHSAPQSRSHFVTPPAASPPLLLRLPPPASSPPLLHRLLPSCFVSSPPL